VRRHELSDGAWARIEPLLPAHPGQGGRWRDHRQVVNGIVWKIRTGADWRDIPERYGPWQTLCQRFRRWSADGTWDRLLEHVQIHDDAIGEVDMTGVCVDSTIVRAHQHSAGARKTGRPARRSAACHPACPSPHRNREGVTVGNEQGVTSGGELIRGQEHVVEVRVQTRGDLLFGGQGDAQYPFSVDARSARNGSVRAPARPGPPDVDVLVRRLRARAPHSAKCSSSMPSCSATNRDGVHQW
jgi:transposase